MTTRKKPQHRREVKLGKEFVDAQVPAPVRLHWEELTEYQEYKRACGLLDDVVAAWAERDNTALEDAIFKITEFRAGDTQLPPIPTLTNAVGLPFKERVKRKLKQYRLDFFPDF